MLDRVMCNASEVGKIVINKCLDLGIEINTVKLEKLLVISNLEMMKKYNKVIFNEKIVELAHGLGIKEVDNDFLKYGIKFRNKRTEHILLLGTEEDIINKVISAYGKYNSFELNKIIDDLYGYKKISNVYTSKNQVQR